LVVGEKKTEEPLNGWKAPYLSTKRGGGGKQGLVCVWVLGGEKTHYSVLWGKRGKGGRLEVLNSSLNPAWNGKSLPGRRGEKRKTVLYKRCVRMGREKKTVLISRRGRGKRVSSTGKGAETYPGKKRGEGEKEVPLPTEK